MAFAAEISAYVTLAVVFSFLALGAFSKLTYDPMQTKIRELWVAFIGFGFCFFGALFFVLLAWSRA